MRKVLIFILFANSSSTLCAQEKNDLVSSIEKQQLSKPLIVINGWRMNQADSLSILDSIDPSIIISVDVLKGDRAIDKFGTDGEGGVVMIDTSSRTQFEPLYIIDGKEVENLKEITASDIASMEVIKDTDKTIKYGARAQHGVILIKLKNY